MNKFSMTKNSMQCTNRGKTSVRDQTYQGSHSMLWVVYVEDIGENVLDYNSTALY